MKNILELPQYQTKYFEDFKEYYRKAQEMEKKSLGLPYEPVDDPLMENVHIYNATERKNAGFSNILEDIWKGNDKEKTYPGQKLPGILPMKRKSFDIFTWHYICLVHRITGSGASFEPDHGYRNTIIPKLIQHDDIWAMIEVIRTHSTPMFTSKGNQIPPFNKPTSKYSKGGIEYLCEIAPILSCAYVEWLQDRHAANKTTTIQEAVDYILDYQSILGWKRFKFVLTAFVMDTAEYYPHLIDPKSHCYYGKNALESMDLMFVNKPKGMNKKIWYDNVMEFLCSVCLKRDGSLSDPYSMEDVLCDYIRYVENYVPKWYLNNLEYDKLENNSKIKDHEPNFLRSHINTLFEGGLFDA